MNRQAGSSPFERQLRAEVRQILHLLERTRRTLRQASLMVARETGASRHPGYGAGLAARRK